MRLSPETCRVKPLRRIKTQLLHLVGLISLHRLVLYLNVAVRCQSYGVITPLGGARHFVVGITCEWLHDIQRHDIDQHSGIIIKVSANCFGKTLSDLRTFLQMSGYINVVRVVRLAG